ncbi:anti-sigma factor [Streptomyces mangrovisoli]|uniref:Regulator of SigK n=1 Tax=Streptomyces mangrovisoli TaxID=1428628 RepID=A0A1J4NVW9_9ACTN|nr:anti-sigma factor [Streptomyces mangrovisoli]OIJ65310.1 hypothetical protein WN71_023795 [Streptomyces mangrovisoli]
MTREDDPHAAVGAYVLHALPPAEEAVFENHLAECAACRREVDELRESAALLGEATRSIPVTPRARARTLDAVARARQDAGRERGRGVPRPRGRRLLRPALAASVAAALALGGIAVWKWHESDDARQRTAQVERQARIVNSAITEVITAPDATVHPGTLVGGRTAAVVVSRSQSRAVFTARGLPVLTGGKVYELWYEGETGVHRPAGLMTGGPGDNAYLMKGRVLGAVSVCVTVEPAGGSPQPTSKPLGAISITV